MSTKPETGALPGPAPLPLSPGRQDVLVAAALDGTRQGLSRLARRTLPTATGTAVGGAWAEMARARPELTAVLHWEDERPALRPAGGRLPYAEVADEEGVREAVREGFPVTLDAPLARLVWTPRTDGTGGEAALVYHPLLCDEASARLLLTDLETLVAGGALPDRDLTGPADATALDPTGPADPTDPALPAAATAGAYAQATAFWRAALAELPGPTPLFPDAAERGDTRPGAVSVTLTPATTGAVHALAAAADSCVLRLTTAVWASVVARFRNEPRCVVGMLVDTRGAARREAVGVYEQVVPVPLRLTGAPALEWLRSAGAWLEEARDRALLPGSALNELSGTERGLALYDSVVDARDEGRLPEPGGHGAPLYLGVSQDAEGLRLTARFLPGAVDEDQAGRLLAAAASALTAAAQDPAAAMDQLPLVHEAELAEIDRHNRTAADYPRDSCLHQVVERQTDLTPDRTALVYEGASLSYAELDRAANKLAHHLIGLGVRPDTVVGLCAEPGLEMNTAILAILKAGGAYAPLDPSFPAERLHYLADDLDCPVVLVQSHLRALLPQIRVPVALDEPERWEHRPEHRPEVDVRPDNLAYVMYTSGSTGRPKGVLIQHGGAVNFVWWISRARELGPDDAALQWTAYSFDAAVWELFWPLFVGARAVLAPPRLHLDLNRFTELIRTERVATLHFVPAMLQTFLTADGAGACTSLRYVFASGEPIPPALAERFHATLDAELINLYGVTEVSIDSTYYVVPGDEELPFVRSGRPMNNETTYVLDRHMRPVPFGARGEVYIGGDSVTRGYLGRPSLTAGRFVPDPFAGGGARLYRTGDVAILLPDGHLHFLGRSDDQVKIRGIRIELHEVEAEIAEHPQVRECLVTAWGAGSERSLAAYVVPREGALDIPALRAFLTERMPGYMVPTSISSLPAFPLGTTGKIDRKALPAPRTTIDDQLTRGVRARTQTEREVAAIWQEVLDVPHVGVLDDFFSVGGNSLLATRVMAAVRTRFGVRLPLRTWLESSAVAELAVAIDRERRGAREAERALDEALAGSVLAPAGEGDER